MSANKKDDAFEEASVSMLVPIAAGKERVKWMISTFSPSPIIKSWQIVMDFDQDGELISCWESSLDKDGNEVVGGGISCADDPMGGGTTTCRGFRLSPLQINALLSGIDHKLNRSALGWLCDLNGSIEPAILFRTVTIRSLHKRGLVDANFNDMRVHDGDLKNVENLDGARHEHSPDSMKFQVWTSVLGKKILAEMGVVDDDNELLYH